MPDAKLSFGVLKGVTTTNIKTELRAILDKIEKTNVVKIKLKIDTTALKELSKQIKAATGGAVFTGSTNQKQSNAIDDAIKSEKQLAAAAKKTDATERQKVNTLTQYDKKLRTIQDYYNKFSSKISKAGLDSKFQSTFADLRSGNYKNSTEAERAITSLMKESRDAGVEVVSLKDKLTNLFGAHLGTAVAMLGVHALQQTLKEVYQTVVELDAAITNLQIATGASRDSTRELLTTYSALGKELGATTAEVATGANDWLRQGYSIEETNELIKDSMVLSKLGQIDSAEATVALTSAMKGYKMEVGDVLGIVDKLTAVDMEAATSAGDIATAMSYTATSARIAGVDMNRLTGYIASVAEVTQAGAEQVGTFYKTLFARMGNVKLGRLIDPETEEDLSAVETVLSGVGIKLRDSNQEFRNFGEVLDETAANWGNYSSVQQRAIAVAFSGTRQQDKFLTLMEHYDEAMKYAGVATESTGTALKKYGDSYLTSVAAKQAKLTATFEQFSTSILSSKLVAGLMDIGSKLLSVVDGTDKLVGTLPRLIALFGGLAVIINHTKFSGKIAIMPPYAKAA